MPLPPDQALDEATHRKVEGSFDSLRIAASQIRSESVAIREEGGEKRLADLLEETSDELDQILSRLMSAAYFGGSQSHGLPPKPRKQNRAPDRDEDQVSLFGETGEDSLAA